MGELVTFAKSGDFAPRSAALSPFHLPMGYIHYLAPSGVDMLEWGFFGGEFFLLKQYTFC